MWFIQFKHNWMDVVYKRMNHFHFSYSEKFIKTSAYIMKRYVYKDTFEHRNELQASTYFL